jgi:gluconate kinase
MPSIPQDNFSKGVYPTLEQRADFISNASQYTKGEILTAHQKVIPRPLIVVVSFSFVNTKLRAAFRDAFPAAHWILVDTHKDLAKERILCREGHFYKAESLNNSEVEKNSSNETNNAMVDNSEWEFQSVDFPHVVLDGRDTVDTNSKLILKFIERWVSHQPGGREDHRHG